MVLTDSAVLIARPDQTIDPERRSHGLVFERPYGPGLRQRIWAVERTGAIRDILASLMLGTVRVPPEWRRFPARGARIRFFAQRGDPRAARLDLRRRYILVRRLAVGRVLGSCASSMDWAANATRTLARNILLTVGDGKAGALPTPDALADPIEAVGVRCISRRLGVRDIRWSRSLPTSATT
jgi:hypothetical protein